MPLSWMFQGVWKEKQQAKKMKSGEENIKISSHFSYFQCNASRLIWDFTFPFFPLKDVPFESR